jgi:hypothetical protein
MKNWRELAQARDLGIPPQELDRVAAPLETLEQAFRPLVRTLSQEMEPAFEFRADGDAE